jgi:hypothetical protein
MSFAEESKSFFDELSNIVDAQKAEQEASIDQRDDRPYSSLLTRDEEPVSDYNPLQAEEAEPEVVTRAGG